MGREEGKAGQGKGRKGEKTIRTRFMVTAMKLNKQYAIINLNYSY